MRGVSRKSSDDRLVHPDVTTYAIKNDAYNKDKESALFSQFVIFTKNQNLE